MGHYACDMRPEWFEPKKPEPPKVTEWFEPHIKPVRVGWFEISFVDCGWQYEWFAWFDGRMWREHPGGWTLMDQQQTWRGMTTEQTK